MNASNGSGQYRLRAHARRILRRLGAGMLAAGTALVLLGCAVEAGPGYGYGSSVGVGVDYYEPYGVAYGGWDPGYYVGPYRGRGNWQGGGSGGPARAFHAASGGHAPPGLPSGARGGGAHAGGGSRH